MEGESAAQWPQFPFCSPRCQTIDLGRWLGQRYRVEPDDAAESPREENEDSDVP